MSSILSFSPTCTYARLFKSLCNRSLSGMFGYLRTWYPACLSMASLLASCLSRPLWLLSSSSMTTRTLNPLLVTTKSAIFCEKLYRLAPPVALSNAPKLTCVSTKYSGGGRAVTSLQNIACSLAVAIGFALKVPFRMLPLVNAARTAAVIARAITRNIRLVSFIASPSLVLVCQS